MTTQEKLEAFAPYLPYELKCICHTNYNGSLDLKQTVLAIGESYVTYRNTCNRCVDVQFADIKPILRPLSDLTKPCLKGGKVPIVELAKIVEMIEPASFDEMTDFEGVARGVCVKDKFNNQWLMFDFKEGFSMWHKPHGCPDHVLTLLDHQLQLFQQLIKWHFWLGDQGEFGKSIIDINTIKTE